MYLSALSAFILLYKLLIIVKELEARIDGRCQFEKVFLIMLIKKKVNVFAVQISKRNLRGRVVRMMTNSSSP